MRYKVSLVIQPLAEGEKMVEQAPVFGDSEICGIEAADVTEAITNLGLKGVMKTVKVNGLRSMKWPKDYYVYGGVHV